MRGERAIHLVSAYGSGLGAVLGQVRTADKSNEITAIPELLDALLLKGAIVTIDAMGCQSTIAARIVKAGADYVLAVKGNQRALLTHIRTTLEAIERIPATDRDVFITEHREVEKDHGRIETRRCIASDVLTRWQQPALWPGMRSIVIVEAIREIGDKVTTERRYYVSSLPPTRPTSPTRCARIGASRIRCIGHSTWPSAKTSAGCGSTTPRRTSPSCDAS